LSLLHFGRGKSKYDTTSRANDKLAKMLHKLAENRSWKIGREWVFRKGVFLDHQQLPWLWLWVTLKRVLNY